MKVSRSRLYSMALESFLERRENGQLMEQADAVFDAPPLPIATRITWPA